MISYYKVPRRAENTSPIHALRSHTQFRAHPLTSVHVFWHVTHLQAYARAQHLQAYAHSARTASPSICAQRAHVLQRISCQQRTALRG